MITAIDIHTELAATGSRSAAASMRGFDSDGQAGNNSALALGDAR